MDIPPLQTRYDVVANFVEAIKLELIPGKMLEQKLKEALAKSPATDNKDDAAVAQLVSALSPHYALSPDTASKLVANGVASLEALAVIKPIEIRKHTGLTLIEAKKLADAASQASNNEVELRAALGPDVSALLDSHGLLMQAGPILVKEAGVRNLAELDVLGVDDLKDVGLSEEVARKIKSGSAPPALRRGDTLDTLDRSASEWFNDMEADADADAAVDVGDAVREGATPLATEE